MAAERKPGDVGVRPRDGARSIAVEWELAGCPNTHSRGLHWHNQTGGWDQIESPRRPLAVLDPESTEDAQRLARLYEKAQADHPDTRTFNMQQALRTYASPEPEIEEPANWLSVVVDIDGVQWYRWSIRPKDHDRAWLSVWDEGRCYPTAWSALRVSRTLSPGVEES